MATVGARNYVYGARENQIARGKPLQRTGATRAALKDVQNKCIFRPSIVPSQTLKEPEKKQTLPTVKFPIVKKSTAKQPSITVKETKACRLRTQHSRQSIFRAPEKTAAKEIVSRDEPIPQPNLKVAKSLSNLPAESDRSVVKAPEYAKPSKETSGQTSNPKIQLKTQSEDLRTNLTKCDPSRKQDTKSAFSSTLLTCVNVVDIDKDDENDPILLGLYAKDLYEYLTEMEVKFTISENYLSNSKLTGKMRATLIDWLVDVAEEFGLCPETFYLSVAIIDRYLEKNPSTSRDRLQLVGVTALLIASKYEEITFPQVDELVYLSEYAYTRREILQMELIMMKSLQYSFGRPLPIHFLRRYSKADMVLPSVHTLAKYILELGVLEYSLCHVRPSLLAAAALYISLWLIGHKDIIWTNNLIQYSNYKEKDLLPIVKKLCGVVMNKSSTKLKAVNKKYAHPKKLQVSTLPVLQKLSELYSKS